MGADENLWWDVSRDRSFSCIEKKHFRGEETMMCFRACAIREQLHTGGGLSLRRKRCTILSGTPVTKRLLETE